MLPQNAISSALDPDVNDDGESYDSAEDEDFQRGTAEQDDADLSSSDAEDEPAERRPLKRRKLTSPVANEPSDSMELDSGDEATIRKARKRRRRNKHKGNKNGQAGNSDDEEDEDVDFDDDGEEGGEGGFVKTRSMRIKVQEERKPLAKIDGASIDVDALWQKNECFQYRYRTGSCCIRNRRTRRPGSGGG
jgi:hypothetical protein